MAFSPQSISTGIGRWAIYIGYWGRRSHGPTASRNTAKPAVSRNEKAVGVDDEEPEEEKKTSVNYVIAT